MGGFADFDIGAAMRVYDRALKKCVEEQEYQQGLLNFLYRTIAGRILLQLIFARPYFSRWRAGYYRSEKSRKKIGSFIERYHVDMSGCKGRYRCFNDFFIRKRAIQNKASGCELAAVADSRLSVYKIDEGLKLKVKNSVYSVPELLHNKRLAGRFANGVCLVFRLGVQDCHRYYHIDDGRLAAHYKIKGLLHTVRSVSEKYRVYCRNTREVSLLRTKHMGDVVQVEIGAMLVGCIHNHGAAEFKRLEEKGYFEYGGSTIIVLLDHRAVIDDDIWLYSGKHIETKVRAGEVIGRVTCNGLLTGTDAMVRTGNITGKAGSEHAQTSEHLF